MYRWAVPGRYVMLLLRPLTVTSRRVAVWQAHPHKQTVYLMYVSTPHLFFAIPKAVENEGIGCVSVRLETSDQLNVCLSTIQNCKSH